MRMSSQPGLADGTERLSGAVSLGVLLLAAHAHPVVAQRPKHPLDPLSTREVWTVYEVMKASGRLDENSRFVPSANLV